MTRRSATRSATVDGDRGSAIDIAQQSDGKLVAAVPAYTDASRADRTNYVVRYLPDGSLDSTFGSGGVAEIMPPTAGTFTGDVATITTQVVGGEERIVVAGTTATGQRNVQGWAVARLRANGTLDLSFGAGGVSTVPITASAQVWDSAVDANGKVLVSGSAASNFEVIRLNMNGSLDGTFGSGGKVTVPVEGAVSTEAGARGIALQNIGGQQRIVLGGKWAFKTSKGSTDMALVRLLPAGAIDPSFGSGGKAIVSIPNQIEAITSIAVDGDNTIVAAGWTTPSGEGGQFTLARFNAAGQLLLRVQTRVQLLAQRAGICGSSGDLSPTSQT